MANSDKWKEMTLGDFVTLQRGHDLPAQHRRKGAIPILGSFGITGWHDKSRVKGPGVTVGRSGASFGVVTYSPVDFWPLNTALFVKDFHGNNEQFAYYFLKTIDFKRYNSGSAQPSLNRNLVHPILVTIPRLPEQRAIAHILGSLDDKIELNLQTISTLEKMAQAIFKSWFIDFDPVRAKAENRDPGQTKEIADLFPDGFEESELGKIPKGWEVKPLTDVIDFKEGPGIRNWQYTNTDEGTRFINIRCIKNGDLVLRTANRISDEEAFGKYAHFHLQEDDLVVSTSGTLGRFAVVRPEHLPLVLNTSVIRMRPKYPNCTLPYLIGYAETSLQLELATRASGSVQKNFGPMHLKQISMLVPAPRILDAHKVVTEKWLRMSLHLRHESNQLARARDTLLPKIISGDLAIPDAEILLEETE